MSLGEVLRRLLEERDITQRQLADRLNIGASTIGNYMQNIRAPDYEMLKCFADFFDVSIDYLLEYKTNIITSFHEDELLRVFRALTKEQQELFIEQGKLFVAQNNKKKAAQI
ncbi:MAG: helix-turn-helix domain-containing protein [Oscillospiraceae bacterium]|nr:helix-turn-helix domain-containing protein [Oscillospiraceae bacterium]